MKILILHHIEPMWERSFCHNPQDYCFLIEQHIQQESYDKIILTTLEYTGGYNEIKHLWDVEEEWSYTWDDPSEYHERYNDCQIDVNDMIPASGHEWAYLYPWIKELQGSDVYLAGGAESECLQDLVDSLNYLNIPNTKVHNLIF